MSEYSDTKVLENTQWAARFQQGSHPAPINVRWSPSNACNHHCPLCPFRAGHNGETADTNQSVEAIKGLAAAGVRALEITGGGEPLLHPCADKFIHTAADAGMAVSLVTNGIRAGEFESKDFQRLSWCRVSVDAALERTYRETRRCGDSDWLDLNQAICQLAQILGDRLSLSFIVTDRNKDEVPLFVAFAADLGVKVVRFTRPLRELSPDVTAEMGAATRIGKKTGVRVIDTTGRVFPYKPRPRCLYCLAAWYVNHDLNVYRCCNRQDRAIGNLAYDDVAAIVERLWKRLPAFFPSEETGCRGCPYWKRNQALEGLLARGKDDRLFV